MDVGFGPTFICICAHALRLHYKTLRSHLLAVKLSIATKHTRHIPCG